MFDQHLWDGIGPASRVHPITLTRKNRPRTLCSASSRTPAEIMCGILGKADICIDGVQIKEKGKIRSNWQRGYSRPRSSTSSTTTWIDSSFCQVSVFAFSISVSLAGAYQSCSSEGWPEWPCQTLPSDSFGSVRSTPYRPQLQSPRHMPAHLPAPRVAPSTLPGQ